MRIYTSKSREPPFRVAPVRGSNLFLNGADATHRAITIGVVPNSTKLDFCGFEAGEITVLVENLSATVAKVIMNFILHNCKGFMPRTFRPRAVILSVLREPARERRGTVRGNR